MDDLEARLEQAKRDRTIQIGTMELMDREIANLEQQIADSEVTYSMGDKFRIDLDEYLLCQTDASYIAMIKIETGNRSLDPVKVEDTYAVTLAEMQRVCTIDKYVRYWDARKQKKC